MKIIGFNHQMSGRGSNVFSDATQGKGATLCASRLHSGSKKRVIKGHSPVHFTTFLVFVSAEGSVANVSAFRLKGHEGKISTW